MLEMLIEELIGEDFSILDFDNKMVHLGFYDEYDAYTEELIESESIVYLSNEDNETQVRVEFEVIMKNGNDEDVRASYIKITDVNFN